MPIAVILICLGVKGDIGVGVLIPIGLIVSLVGAHIMYKKNLSDPVDKSEGIAYNNYKSKPASESSTTSDCLKRACGWCEQVA